MQTDHLIPTRRPDQEIVKQQKKRTFRVAGFVVVKIKENEKRDK